MWKASPAASSATPAVAAAELEKILKVFNLIKSTDIKLIKVRTYLHFQAFSGLFLCARGETEDNFMALCGVVWCDVVWCGVVL